MRRGEKTVAFLSALFVVSAGAAHAGPLPMGTSTTTISYETDSDPFSASGDRDYNGAFPSDATVLVGADNIKIFNSVNQFGRRPLVPGALGPNESVIAHAFFKSDVDAEYFPGLADGGNITLRFENVHFDQPVTVVEDTMMLHALFRAEQVDELDNFYLNLDNHYTATPTFRDEADFYAADMFRVFPVPSVMLDAIDPVVSGNGTDTIDIELTFPYALLEHLEEQGQVVPAGLPAPQGFLEPFHFHLEYVVAPEPGTAALVVLGVVATLRRRGGCRARR
ncbi:MAG: hypothetical protein PVI86_20050 [Phycisphaerae bacterium]|jgi:hypothetical protein